MAKKKPIPLDALLKRIARSHVKMNEKVTKSMKKLKKSGTLLFILIFLSIILSIGFAQSRVLKQGEFLIIDHTATTGGTPTTNINCNITVRDPDQVLLVSFQPMTFNTDSRTHNFTLNKTQTNKFGEYNYDIFCTDGELNITKSFTFLTNVAGQELSDSVSRLYGISLFILSGLFGLFLFGFLKIPFRNERSSVGLLLKINWRKYLKMSFLAGISLMAIFILMISFNIFQGFLQIQGVGNIFGGMYRFAMSIFVSGFFLTLIFMIFIFFKDLQLDKKIKEGKLLPSVTEDEF